ncbi:MAG: hypothetical protein GX896_01030 [Clostridiales bacterium]|nr:hypothetical protein [Clostridiales bacterium]
MDVYKEQLVKKATTSRDDVRKIMLIIAAISLSALIFTFLFPTPFAMIGLFLIGVVIYGTYHLITGMSVEYEYLMTNGDLDIDKITAQRSRKRLTTVKIPSITAFEKLTESSDINPDHTIINASDFTGENDWYIEFRHNEYGMCCLVFSPDEEMIDVIKPFLPRALRLK